MPFCEAMWESSDGFLNTPRVGTYWIRSSQVSKGQFRRSLPRRAGSVNQLNTRTNHPAGIRDECRRVCSVGRPNRLSRVPPKVDKRPSRIGLAYRRRTESDFCLGIRGRRIVFYFLSDLRHKFPDHTLPSSPHHTAL